MKLRWHILFLLIGALSLQAFGFIVNEIVTPEPRWYQMPLFFPVYVGTKFGTGGVNVNATAVNLVWIGECLLAGVILDMGVVLLRRFFHRANRNTRS